MGIAQTTDIYGWRTRGLFAESTATARSRPTVTAADDGTGTSFTLTIDGDAGATHKIKWRVKGNSGWTAATDLTGDGTRQITGATGNRWHDWWVATKNANGVGYGEPELGEVFVPSGSSKHKAIMDATELLVEALAWTGWGTSQVDVHWRPGLGAGKGMKYPRVIVAPGQEPDDCPDRSNTEFETIYPVRIFLEDKIAGKAGSMDDVLYKREQLRTLFKTHNVLNGVSGVFMVEVNPFNVVVDRELEKNYLGTGLLLRVHVNEVR